MANIKWIYDLTSWYWIGRNGRISSCGPNSKTLLVFYGYYIELILNFYQDLFLLSSVKEHCIFKKLTHRFLQCSTPLFNNLCRDRLFVLVGEPTDLPVKMINSVLDGVGGYGEGNLEGGFNGVISILCVAGDIGCFWKEFCEGAPMLGNGSIFLKHI